MKSIALEVASAATSRSPSHSLAAARIAAALSCTKATDTAMVHTRPSMKEAQIEQYSGQRQVV
jgi:hypothetical protein